jgi:hypothetical protein
MKVKGKCQKVDKDPVLKWEQVRKNVIERGGRSWEETVERKCSEKTDRAGCQTTH